MQKNLYILFFLSSFVFAGCGTMANGRGWGQDATITPGWDRVGTAALHAVAAPETWAPAAGALAFRIGHSDRKVSDWASRSSPVFGSRENAQRMSDNLLKASGAVWGASVIATPGGDTLGEWSINKVKGFAVQEGSALLMKETVGVMKRGVGRTRPNGHDQESFPSGHASAAAVYNTMTSKNLDAFDMGDTPLIISRIGLGGLTAATSWARVEAQQHFPSDVMAGIAIGHFFGAFFTDAFLGMDNPRNVLVLFEPARGGALARVRFDF